jgi:hypothetical protein
MPCHWINVQRPETKNLEDEGSVFLGNTGNRLPSDAAVYAIRTVCSTVLLFVGGGGGRGGSDIQLGNHLP